jgi:hypothetical protein
LKSHQYVVPRLMKFVTSPDPEQKAAPSVTQAQS